MPKYFVAFGMILTLLEDEFLAAGRAMEHYRLLFAAHPHPMWVHDPETLRILEVNDAAVTHYGYSREEFQSMTLRDLRPGEDVGAIFMENPNPTKLSGPWRHRRKDGSYIQVDMASHRIDYMGRRCSFVLVQDVTDRQQLHEQLVYQAHHDALTGLPNRLLLEDRMQQSLAQAARYGQQAAVLCLDLDRFKQINDSFGHAAGDLCLQQVVARISARLRAVDTFARTGGDEFVILLGELANKSSALTVARSVLESISKPIEAEGISFDISGSIGISIYPDDGTDSVQLRRSADAAMYRAKQAGGGQYLLVSSQISSSASELSELERFMRSALKGDGLELYYQPQYSMVGNLCGLEAILRMNHPQQGTIAADRFLPVAEERGLIVPLGDWVLDEVCRQSMEWQSRNLAPLRISFFVSPLQFLHSDFSARVLSTVTRCGLDPRLLELIVTESTVMRNRPEVASQMRSLAALGRSLFRGRLWHQLLLPEPPSSASCQHAQDRLLLRRAHLGTQRDLYHRAGHHCAGPRLGAQGRRRRRGARRSAGVPAHPGLRFCAGSTTSPHPSGCGGCQIPGLGRASRGSTLASLDLWSMFPHFDVLGRLSRSALRGHDHAACDSVACIARRVGHHVVRFRVNHECRAPVGEDRIFRVLLERNAVGHEGDVVRAVRHHLQVKGHVAGMRSLGILGSVLFVVGIEMGACGLEIRSIAFCILMDVQRMLAFGKIHQVQLDLNALAVGGECRCSRVLTVAGLEVHFNTLVSRR